jgi:hypothetical protein
MGGNTRDDVNTFLKATTSPQPFIIAMNVSDMFIKRMCTWHPGSRCELLRSQEEDIANAIQACIERSLE